MARSDITPSTTSSTASNNPLTSDSHMAKDRAQDTNLGPPATDIKRVDIAVIAIIGLAIVVRLIWLLLVVNKQWSDVTYYDESARHLAHTFELRYIDPEVRTIYYRAWFPPGWPFLLAIFYRIFGESLWLVKIVNLGLAGLTVYLTIRIGSKIFNRRVGLIGGLLLALLPGQIFYVSLAQYEIFLTALLACILLLLIETDWPRINMRSLRLHGAGLLLAWATLTRPLLVLLPIAFVPYLVQVCGRRRGWLFAGVMTAYIAIACGSWGLRNMRVIGEPVLFSTNGGYNLWHGNNPHATGGAFTPQGTNPRLNPMLIQDNELVMNRECYRFAVEYIKANPMRFIAMIPHRLYHLYNTDTTSLYISFLYAPLERPTILQRWRDNPHFIESFTFRTYVVTMAFALLGLVLADWRSTYLRLIGAILIYWHFWVTITFGQDRYRVPIMTIYCLFAAYAIDRILKIMRSRSRETHNI